MADAKPKLATIHPFAVSSNASIARTALSDSSLLSGPYWAELRIFLAVAKAGSLKRAADNLGVSHTTVGRDIRRLQDLVGCQLVLVSKSGVKLTQRGHDLAQKLIHFDEQLHVVTRDLRAERRRTEGIVRVSITDGLGVLFVAPALRGLQRDYPGIQVHLKTPLNFQSFAENRTDCMVGFSPDPRPEVTSRQLGWLHFIPICTQAYVARRGLATCENAHLHEFLDSEQYSAEGTVWDPWRQLIQRGHLVYAADASITYALLVKCGLGIGLLGNFTVVEPSVIPLDLDVRIRVPLYAIAATERLNSRPVSIVFEMLSTIFAPSQHWFSAELRTRAGPPETAEGYNILFNL